MFAIVWFRLLCIWAAYAVEAPAAAPLVVAAFEPAETASGTMVDVVLTIHPPPGFVVFGLEEAPASFRPTRIELERTSVLVPVEIFRAAPRESPSAAPDDERLPGGRGGPVVFRRRVLVAPDAALGPATLAGRVDFDLVEARNSRRTEIRKFPFRARLTIVPNQQITKPAEAHAGPPANINPEPLHQRHEPDAVSKETASKKTVEAGALEPVSEPPVAGRLRLAPSGQPEDRVGGLMKLAPAKARTSTSTYTVLPKSVQQPGGPGSVSPDNGTVPDTSHEGNWPQIAVALGVALGICWMAWRLAGARRPGAKSPSGASKI